MHVLHAHFRPPSELTGTGGFLVWAEAPAPGTTARSQARKPPLPHPFAAIPEDVAAVLDQLADRAGHAPPRWEDRRMVLWLPTRAGRPQASAPWLDQSDEDAGDADAGSSEPGDAEKSDLTLAEWVIDGAWLSLADACRLLLRTPEADDLPDGVRLGDDWRFWQAAARLVLEVVAAQRVLPGLVTTGPDHIAGPGHVGGGDPYGEATFDAARTPAGKPSKSPRARKSPAAVASADPTRDHVRSPRSPAQPRTYEARWLPVLDDAASAGRLVRLADAMPGVCRAGAATPAKAPDPTSLLDAFLNAATDAMARKWGAPARAPQASGATGAWLKALFVEDAGVRASGAQLEHLQAAHQAWVRNLFVSGDRTTCVAFRLQEPTPVDPSEQAWRLHFLLQARDDPSLLVPADAVWKLKGSELPTLGRRFHQPQAKLLAGLAYAARLVVPVRRALAAQRPVVAKLSTEEAYAFLREAAPVLQAAGFGLIVPTWWGRPEGRLGVRLKLKSSNGSKSQAPGVGDGLLSLGQLVQFEWEVALGGKRLTRKELERLVALKRPLVELRGQWVQLDPTQVEAAIRFWERHPVQGEMSQLEALGWGLGGEEQVAGLPVEAVEAAPDVAAWLAALKDVGGVQPVDPPPGLLAELRPYQVQGLAWLAHRVRAGLGGILADDMGLGKTVQLLALLEHLKTEGGRLPGPVLLVAPTSVVTNWARESARFTPGLLVQVHQGPDRHAGEAFAEAAAGADLVVTSYSLMRRDVDALSSVAWYGVVLDEAQQIKNADSRQARVARQLGGRMRFALTGTPVENRLSELWSILEFLAPGYLGSQETFRRRIAIPVERHNDTAALRRLRKLTQPFILRRLKTDPTVIRDLPAKQESTVYCPLTPEQVTLYEAVVRKTLEDIELADGMERRGKVLGLLTRLKQICNHPAHYLAQLHSAALDAEAVARSGKLVRLVEILEELLAAGDRVLIFSQFAEMGGALKRMLQVRLGVEALFLHGGDPPARRDAMVRRFQEDEAGPPIFLLSLKAGGTGLNLTRANHVVHFDRWWNPAVEDQATDRAFRIGQTRNVFVHKFVCTGTLEERIHQLLERKKALAESVVGSGGEQWLTELSNAELRELVRLRREALAE